MSLNFDEKTPPNQEKPKTHKPLEDSDASANPVLNSTTIKPGSSSG
jgi:hypothetical protein